MLIQVHINTNLCIRKLTRHRVLQYVSEQIRCQDHLWFRLPAKPLIAEETPKYPFGVHQVWSLAIKAEQIAKKMQQDKQLREIISYMLNEGCLLWGTRLISPYLISLKYWRNYILSIQKSVQWMFRHILLSGGRSWQFRTQHRPIPAQALIYQCYQVLARHCWCSVPRFPTDVMSWDVYVVMFWTLLEIIC